MTNSEKMVRNLQSQTAKRGQMLALLEADFSDLKADIGLIRECTPFKPCDVIYRLKAEIRRNIRALAFEQKVDRMALKAIHKSRADSRGVFYQPGVSFPAGV